jgi:Transposase DDE domain
MTISFVELLTVLFVLVDNWYQTEGARLRNRTVGAKTAFSDSEMLTLMLAVDLLEFTSERRFRAFIQANHLDLFPQLLTQSQFNRRARALRFLLDALHRAWAQQLGLQFEHHFLLDSTPVPVVGYRRDKTHSEFYGSAAYGYCAARRLKYFGYKLVLLSTLEGTPFTFELVPANTDERVAADEILDTLPADVELWVDKGFIGEDWQAEWRAQGVRIWSAKRINQHQQNPPAFDRLLNAVRERIETTYDQLKEGGRSLERTLAITIDGLCARVTAKIASLTMRLFLKKFFGIDVLTYTINPVE